MAAVFQSPLRVTMLLADAAQVVDGKLYILGGGWELCGPDPTPSALVIKIDVPRDETSKPHKWELWLEDADGRSILPPEASPITGPFEVPTPQDPSIEYVPVPLALGFSPLPIKPGQRYTWRLYVDGRTDELWNVSFAVRQAAEAMPPPAQ